MFFIIEKSEETTFGFSKNSVKMEMQKIVNLLNNSENEYSRLATKNRILLIVNRKVIIHTKIQ